MTSNMRQLNEAEVKGLVRACMPSQNQVGCNFDSPVFADLLKMFILNPTKAEVDEAMNRCVDFVAENLGYGFGIYDGN